MEKNSCFPSLAFVLFFNIITTLTSSTPFSNSTTDQLALLAFKNTITSDPHALLTNNWSTHTSLCNWIGVTCGVKHHRVTALNISHFDLGGTIAPHVGNLTFLRSLDISFNNFSGIIPSTLSNLRRLEEFNAGFNTFAGEIPSWFGALSQLRRMNLSNNIFSGRVPHSLFNISRLQILDVGYNFLHGDIPEEVGNLSSLQVLNLGFNNLTGSVPKGIFNVSSLVEIILRNNILSNSIPSDVCYNTPRLKIISLSINQLSGEIPANIWKCRELEVLFLSANHLNGSIPGEIGSLSMLSELSLGLNDLQGFIPEQVGNLTSLKHLDLGGNHLKGSVPSSIFNISALKALQLSFNQFDGNLPSVVGISLSNLEELRLSGNKFSGPIPSSIINASKLTILEINHNSFTGSIPNFGDLRLLRVLRIWGNNLTGEESISQELGFLSSLTDCRYLEILEVSENPLNGILPAASIANLSNSLLQFWAGGCNINGVIPPEIGNLSSLLELYLNENQMTGYIPSTIGKLKNLQGMSLSNNQLQGHIPHHLCQMNNLAELDLSANMLTGPIPECFGKVESLRNLNLGSNKLNSTIPSNFWDLNKLLTLNLSSNYLSGNLSTQIGNLKAIYRMDLSSNQFSGDIPSSFDGCQSLETLSLSNNMLTGSIPQSLGSVRGLSRLDLSNNNLSGLIPESLEKLFFLEHFNVSYNSLDGEIPNEGPFVNFSAQSFVHNSVLCGSARFQVPPCMKSHTRSRPRSKDAVQLIFFIVASFIAVIFWGMGIFLSIIFVIIIRRQKEARIPPHLVDHQTSLGGAWTVISYRELVQVTSGFSETNLIGRGGIGSVYKGTLSNGLSIAVKVFNLELRGAAESFRTETEILSSIRHRNLIRVLGCCANAEFKALVLAYMPNGSLEKLLYSDTYYLNLVQRLNIAVDVALALEYLHHHHTFPVVHCDIKPSNVLLDQDITAHLADFGIAKLFDEGEAQVRTTTLQGTIGYAAPEYGFEESVSTMGDVYSYGIMLLEMFTRKKPTDNMFNGEINLKEWVYDAIERNTIRKVVDPVLLSTQDQHFLPKEWLCEAIERNPTSEVVDPALLSTQDHHFLPKVLRSVFYLAMKCLTNSPYERINMIEVAYNLQKIKYNVDNEMTRKSSPYYSIAEGSPQATQTSGSQLLAS